MTVSSVPIENCEGGTGKLPITCSGEEEEVSSVSFPNHKFAFISCFPVRFICTIHLILLDLITQTVLTEDSLPFSN
jgi:hypothetical protein